MIYYRFGILLCLNEKASRLRVLIQIYVLVNKFRFCESRRFRSVTNWHQIRFFLWIMHGVYIENKF